MSIELNDVREYCPLDDAGKSLLRAAMSQLGMSARAFHRILQLGSPSACSLGER
jgi:magnesium chelatase family protein